MNTTRNTTRPAAAIEPDWALLRAFVAVVESGSLTRAAQRLGSSQPTLSRQMTQLEAQIGSALFERTRRGLTLTAAGKTLSGPALRMQEHAREWSISAAGRSSSLAGTVRLTASEVVSTYLLPAVLLDLREAHPEIQIELVASNDVANLLERDADIALRMVRPTQAALVARKVAELPLGIYAHRDYVAKHGRPRRANLLQHAWVGYDRSDLMLRGFRAAGLEVSRDLFGFRCDNQVVAWEAVCAGMGLRMGLERVASRSPQLVRVLRDLPIDALPVWITAHRELRGTPRLQCVFDALVSAFAAA